MTNLQRAILALLLALTFAADVQPFSGSPLPLLSRLRSSTSSSTTSFGKNPISCLFSSRRPTPGVTKKTSDVLSLESIRSSLIRQEETIIFALIERAQFYSNDVIYSKAPGVRLLGYNSPPLPVGAVWRDPAAPPSSTAAAAQQPPPLSFLDYMLMGTEVLHSTVRRYTSPEEHAFFPNCLPPPLEDLAKLDYPSNLLSPINGAHAISLNAALLRRYITDVVPRISVPGDDEQYGSSVLCDVSILQALSKRIHYGKFVAESKYRASPELYERLVKNDDRQGVMDALTDKTVETRVLRRAALKCATYGREPLLNVDMPVWKAVGKRPKEGEGDDLPDSEAVTMIVAAAASAAAIAAVEATMQSRTNGASGLKVDPMAIEEIYRDLIIPLTKEVEVEYLFARCGRPTATTTTTTTEASAKKNK